MMINNSMTGLNKKRKFKACKTKNVLLTLKWIRVFKVLQDSTPCKG